MSLYGQFIAEREGKSILESEKGFATYSYNNDCVYVENIFVHPDHRKTGEASKMTDKIASIAVSKGYKKMLTSVVPSAKGSTESLMVVLAYGFELDSSTNNFILFKKDL